MSAWLQRGDFIHTHACLAIAMHCVAASSQGLEFFRAQLHHAATTSACLQSLGMWPAEIPLSLVGLEVSCHLQLQLQ